MTAWEDFGRLAARFGSGETEEERARQAWQDEAMRRDAREMMVRTGGLPAVDVPGADLTQEEIGDYGGRWGVDTPPPEFSPQVAQQLEALEGAFGPLTDGNRQWIGAQLAGGMSLGQAIQQLEQLRENWRP